MSRGKNVERGGKRSSLGLFSSILICEKERNEKQKIVRILFDCEPGVVDHPLLENLQALDLAFVAFC